VLGIQINTTEITSDLGELRLQTKEFLFFLEKTRRSLENKRKALDKLFKSGRISHSVYNSFGRDLSDSLSLVEQQIKKVKEHAKNKLLKLEEQASLLEKVISDLELTYRLNNVDEGTYSLNMSSLLVGLDAIKGEMKNLYDSLQNKTFESSEELKHKEIAEVEIRTKEPPLLEKTSKIEKIPTRRRKRRYRIKEKVDTKEDYLNEYVPEIEPGLICRNPWKKNCSNTDIEVFIYYGEEYIPICSDCWRKLAEKDLSW